MKKNEKKQEKQSRSNRDQHPMGVCPNINHKTP
jgi:hypothetical protein